MSTSVFDVSVSLKVVVGCSVVYPVHAIDGVRRATQLRQVAYLNLFWNCKCKTQHEY